MYPLTIAGTYIIYIIILYYHIILFQIAFAYGYGAIKWGYDPYNAIYVPNALFSYTEDESQ